MAAPGEAIPEGPQQMSLDESFVTGLVLSGQDHEVCKCSPMLHHQIKEVKPNVNTLEKAFTTINYAENEHG